MSLGHWTYNGNFDSSCFGFLYNIVNKQTGRTYIGIKQTTLKRGNRRVPSDWQSYMGSSKLLAADIARLGKGNFIFRIISLHADKVSLKIAETKSIIETGAIFSDAYYNQLLRIRIVNRKLK